MTQEQQEGNRVIADWYGEKYSPSTDMWYKVKPESPQTPCAIYEMRFHSSHDWLQPVAKRVKEELIGLGKSKQELYEQAFGFINMLNGAAATFDISQLFPAVVRAVQFINSINQKEK